MKGGKKIGQGKFGCVLYPALIQPPEEAYKYVTKLFTKEMVGLYNTHGLRNEKYFYTKILPTIPNNKEFITQLAPPDIKPLKELNYEQKSFIDECTYLPKGNVKYTRIFNINLYRSNN